MQKGKLVKDIVRVLKYVLHFKRYILLNILFNIFFVFFSLFSFGMIIPFLEILFNLSNTTPVPVDFAFNKEIIYQWVIWNLYSFKESHGILISIILISVLYVTFSLLSNISRYFAMYFNTPLRNGIVMKLRNDLYHKTTILPISFFKKYQKGDLLSRFSSDLFEIEWSVAVGLNNFIKEPLTILVYGITLIVISPKLMLFTIILAPLAFFLIKKIGKSLNKNANRAQMQIGEVMAVNEETLTGIKVIKAFSAENLIQQKFEEKNEKYTRSIIKTLRRKEAGAPLIEIISMITLVFIITYGGSLVISNAFSGSVLIFFVVIFSRLIPSIQKIITSFYDLQKGKAAAKRIFEVLDGDEKIIEITNPKEKSSFENKIEYRDVSFSYQHEESGEKEPTDVLKSINLTIEKGKSVAIVGPSGSGKTTLVDLFPRFYDCTSGEILIDNIPIKDLKISDLRGLIGIVSQECILFNDTILHNIAFGQRAISEEEIIRAAKIANADEFICALPNGYYTSIGDRGLTLSGGQRQRLSIARAILRNPDILILDEATSALDTESEYLVQEALNRIMQGRTSIIIAHRLSTIQHVDKIVVLEKGIIVEEGTHAELIAKNGVYKNLVDFQDIK